MSKMPRDIRSLLDSKSASVDNKFKKELKSKLMKETEMSDSKKSGILHLIRQHKMVPLSASLLALLVVSGGSAFVANNRQETARRNQIELPTNIDQAVSIDEIRTKALELIPGGEITSIELEQEDGKLLYKVKFIDGSFVLYDAVTGALYIEGDEFETDESVPASFVPGITIQDARSIAQTRRPGETITKIELETEEGKVVYSVRFSDDGRVDVDATSGEVLRIRGEGGEKVFETEDDDDDSDDSPDDSEESDDENDSGSDDDNDEEDGDSSDSSGSGSDDDEEDSDDDN